MSNVLVKLKLCETLTAHVSHSAVFFSQLTRPTCVLSSKHHFIISHVNSTIHSSGWTTQIPTQWQLNTHSEQIQKVLLGVRSQTKWMLLSHMDTLKYKSWTHHLYNQTGASVCVWVISFTRPKWTATSYRLSSSSSASFSYIENI